MVHRINSPARGMTRTLHGAPAPRQATACLPRALRVPLSALLTCAAVPLLVLISVGALERGGASTTGPIYSVASVRAAIAHGQLALLNRPLRVRAVVGVCTTWVSRCFDWEPVLVDDRRAPPVQLNWQPTLLTRLRRIPLLGSILPGPHPVQWGARAVYRVVFHVADRMVCRAAPCLQADLLDASQPTE